MTAIGTSLTRHSWRALGNPCRIMLRGVGDDVAGDFIREAVDWLNTFEVRYSRFLDNSLISCINRNAGKDWVELQAQDEALFELCDSLNYVTRGTMDPTMAPLVALWYKQKTSPDESQIEAARELVGWHQVERKAGAIRLPKPGMCLDLGGFGKEYAVDFVAQMAEARGIPHYLIDFGRDIRLKGSPSERPGWHIGIEDPCNPGKGLMGLGMLDGAIAASGDYHQFFVHNGVRYGHIIDPKSGYPVSNGTRAVHVLADTCLAAGIHSTSAFILGIPDSLELLEQTYGVEGIIITESENHYTQNFYQYVSSR